jgi:hypothetical protein
MSHSSGASGPVGVGPRHGSVCAQSEAPNIVDIANHDRICSESDCANNLPSHNAHFTTPDEGHLGSSGGHECDADRVGPLGFVDTLSVEKKVAGNADGDNLIVSRSPKLGPGCN